MVRKSGMSIKDCVQGFRIAQAMKRMGIPIDSDDSGQNNYSDFFSFVEDLYLACKELGVPPGILPIWFNDLRVCYAMKCLDQQHPNQDIAENIQHEYEIYANGEGGTPFSSENQTNSATDKDHDSCPLVAGHMQPLGKKVTDNYLKTNQPLPNDGAAIPFMSRISRFLEIRKEECSRLTEHKTSLTSETKNLKAEKDKMQDKINRIYEKEQYVTYYLEWFYKLREELWNKHSIRIEAIGEFAKVINDFAAHGYDAYKIISEYNDFQSIKDETMAARCRLLNLEKKEQDLRDKIAKLESQCESVTQTMNTYSELKKVGLGLKQLKQLLSTIMEIANANGIPNDKAVDRFFRNIREQYDNKLGFEKKVDEKMMEIVETENKLAVSQAYLQLQPQLGPILNDFL